jgi:hypothetical protein
MSATSTSWYFKGKVPATEYSKGLSTSRGVFPSRRHAGEKCLTRARLCNAA